MKVAVNPTEYFDDEAPAKPDNIVQPEVVEEVKPKSEAKAKAKSKVKVVEALPEPVLEQVLERVLEPVEVKPKRSTLVEQSKQSEPVASLLAWMLPVEVFFMKKTEIGYYPLPTGCHLFLSSFSVVLIICPDRYLCIPLMENIFHCRDSYPRWLALMKVLW